MSYWGGGQTRWDSRPYPSCARKRNGNKLSTRLLCPPPKKMVPPAHVQSWCFSRSTRCQFGGRQKIWYFKDTDESCLKWHGAIFGLFKISKRCLQMHMSVARKNAETSTRGKKVWVAFPQFYVLRCGLWKKMAVQAFSRKQLNPYGRRYAATLITSFVLG